MEQDISLQEFSREKSESENQVIQPSVVVENVSVSSDSSIIPIKCKRCHLIFTPSEFAHTKCFYHPGEYHQSIYDDWGWTCCAKDVYANLKLFEFFDTSDPLFDFNIREKIRNSAKKFTEKHSDKILSHQKGQKDPKKAFVEDANDSKEEFDEQDFEELTSEDHKTNNNSQITSKDVVPTNTEKSLTTISGVVSNTNSRFYKFYSKKRMNQTMSVLEKIKSRDDPELSVLLPDSIGCTIAGNSFLILETIILK